MNAEAAQSNVVELMTDQPIVAYNPFRTQMAELREINSKTIFQYHTATGMTAAKSYIRKLQSTASAIEKVRKQEKAESLSYGRRVDAQAKEIEGEVRAMIAVHQKPIDEIEQKEAERIAAIRKRIDRIKGYQFCEGHDVEETAKALKLLHAVNVDESFGEFQVEVTIEIAKAVEAQTNRQVAAQEEEEAAAETARIKAEEDARVQKERDDRIASEAAANATKEAEERATAEAARVKRQHDEEIRLANEQKERAERDAAKAVEDEQKREAKRQKDEADAAAAREADKAHGAKINNEVKDAIIKVASILDAEERAVAIVTAIASGKIPHTKIIY